MSLRAVVMALAVTCGFCLHAERNGLDVARAALRDGLWDMARTYAGAATNDESRLVVLESYAGEGRWRDVAEVLKG